MNLRSVSDTTTTTKPRRRSVALSVAERVVAGWVIVSATLAGVGLLLTKVLFADGRGWWDEQINRWFVDQRTDLGNRISGFFSWSGTASSIVGMAIAVALVLLITRHRQPILLLVIGLPLELAMFLTVSVIVDRPRPDVPKLNMVPATASFPSGHIAASLVLFGLIALIIGICWPQRTLQRVAWALAVVVPVAVGASRVYRGMHHFTDVVAGEILGIGALVVTVFAYRAIYPRTDSPVGSEETNDVHRRDRALGQDAGRRPR